MSLLFRALVPALSLFLFPAMASPQTPVEEIEPNDPCAVAQDLEGVGVPFYVPGQLDATVQTEVDFFRIVSAPGLSLRIDLEGSATDKGTLGDPFLGFFDSECVLQMVDDDAGVGFNSRLYVTMPDDGIAVIGVTRCCDAGFAEGGEGTYTLTVAEPVFIRSVGGRAVDADTSLPLPGDVPPYAWVTLNRCDVYGCYEWVSSGPAGPDGTFLFETDAGGYPIPVGTFQVTVYATMYEMAYYGPFEVGDGEAYETGDIPVTPFQVIGAVSGRLVDALSGLPLSGSSPPFGRVDLERCEEWGCYGVAYGLPSDAEGLFRIEGPPFSLSPAMYRVIAMADDYHPFATEPAWVGDDEEVDFGDIALIPLPIGFGEVTGCDFLPIGGTCEFSVQVTNRGPGRYRGEAWAIARYFSLDYPNRANRFQIGRLGAQNPNPIRVNLAKGKTTTLTFRLDVPTTAPEGTSLCITANVGRDPAPQFDAAGERLLFCAVAQPGGLARLSAKESNALLKKLEPKGR